MKYVCFSFDDARFDTFDVAFPILKKYGLTATVNVITDYIENPENYHFASGPKSMTPNNLLEWEKEGFEIACHGRTHRNTAKDVIENIEDLKAYGIETTPIGFASPESYITDKNIDETGISALVMDGVLSYVRTGVQVKREGITYLINSVIERATHSKWLFYNLNKKNIHSIDNIPEILLSVAIKSFTTIQQITYLLNQLNDNQVVILMFHSILKRNDPGFGKDYYYWDVERFEELCRILSDVADFKVIRTIDLFSY